jgi:hypothetical protein
MTHFRFWLGIVLGLGFGWVSAMCLCIKLMTPTHHMLPMVQMTIGDKSFVCQPYEVPK